MNEPNPGMRDLEVRVLDLISTGAPLGGILAYICHHCDALLPGAMSSIMLLEEDGRLYCAAAPRFPAEFMEATAGIAVAPVAGACGTAVWRREQVVCVDVLTDPLWADCRQLAQQFGFRACWSTPILAGSGSPLGTFALYYDHQRAPTAGEQAFIGRISRFVQLAIERTREARQLRESEERYRSIFDLVQVSIWEEDWSQVATLITRLRQQGVTDFRAYLEAHLDVVRQAIASVRILDMNPASLRIFEARSKADLLGSLEVVFSTPDTIPGFIDQLVAFAEGERIHEGELMVRTVTGKPVYVALTLVFPNPEQPDQPALVSLLDVTQRRKAEERFRTVAQTTNDLVWDLDLSTGRLWWQDGPVRPLTHQREGDEQTLKSWTSQLHPDEREQVEQTFFDALDSDATHWAMEYRFKLPTGKWGQVLGRCQIMRDASGTAVRVVGSMIDVTEQRELEAKLAQAQRLDAVGQLTGGVAHDFNNLLTVMLGNASLLTDELEGQPELQALARMTLEAAQRGRELTTQLLAFARRQALTPEPTDVAVLIEGMVPLLRRTLGEQIRLRLELEPAPWPVEVDSAQFESALLNLCLNARDAMPDGGELCLRVRNMSLDRTDPDSGPGSDAVMRPSPPSGEHLCVCVEDTGVGMDARTRDHAFEPFFTTKQPGDGSGLGLSMVYGFIKQSSGHVALDSQPGGGTRVRLYLPRSDATLAAAPEEQRPSSAPRGSEHVLVVEDNPLVREYAMRQLQALGYQVTLVADGPEALASLTGDDSIQVLFSDVVMPGGISGTELMRRALELRPGLRILLTSGYARGVPDTQHANGHRIELLRKPYDRDALGTALRRALDT